MKLTNCLQVRVTNVFLTTIFRLGLLPYLRLSTTGMKKNTLIKHKETTVVCEESGPISLSYNVLVTTPKANAVVKPTIPIVIVKSTLTCTNYHKTSHSVETYHNKKTKIPIMPTVIMKYTNTQLVKLGKISVHYPYIICSSIEHKFRECPRKIEVQNVQN